MNFKNYILNFFIVIALSLPIIGCNSTEDIADDSSKEEEVEKGLMALDKRNYKSAEDIFENLKKKYSTDNTLKTYYSNALAGAAGLDTFRLMESIDDMDDKNSDDSIEIVGRTLTGAESGDVPSIDKEQLTQKITNFEKAINSILEIIDSSYDEKLEVHRDALRSVQGISISKEEIAELTDDELVQLGLMGLNHSILIISDILLEYANTEEIVLTQAGFDDLSNKQISINDINSIDDIESKLTKLSLNIEIIESAVDAIVAFLNLDQNESNDIKDEFDDFKKDLDKDGNGTVSTEELQHYINKQ